MQYEVWWPESETDIEGIRRTDIEGIRRQRRKRSPYQTGPPVPLRFTLAPAWHQEAP